MLSEMLTAMITKNTVFWDVSPCSLADIYRISVGLHGVLYHKTAFFRTECR
jgi:hypothetical protein